ncbi:YraN family protein [Sediminispirochaeta bajacaliforniensis]|uniref:YraN family protein n=1 Tax=Sediminispirochaeta bajacaliforniensis TaxID=148 RepID=UPI000366DDE1|nr:YraN family protein [Sediminispirochaeta bajacaliforniensis]
MNRVALGRKGEEHAVHFLLDNGYEILARNYRFGGGEVDIIAGKDDRIHFVEVKSWKAYGMENLEYALNAKKQARIIAASRGYLAKHASFDKDRISFDFLFLDASGIITHLTDVFSETGMV